MADRLTKEQRRRNMSAIKGKNTAPELAVRKLLHRLGFRFRLHDRRLPGTPDIVLPKYRTVVLVHGCFWHMHGCARTRIPQTRTDFWISKLERNRARDEEQEMLLRSMGWTVIVIWGCELKMEHTLIERIQPLLDRQYEFTRPRL